MNAESEVRVLDDYLVARRLRRSRPRRAVLEVFLRAEHHLTADEIYRRVRSRYPALGAATVYRTLKILCECGLCREVAFEDGVARYEHQFNHEHHDHLVCTACGRVEEVVDPEIEKLQERLARRNGFEVQRHRMELYGRCRRCRPEARS